MHRLRPLIPLLAGALTLGAFAPFSVWPLAVAGPLLWLWASAGGTPGRWARDGWLFGLGLFGFGVSWLHLSIGQFGGVSPWVAVGLNGLFVLILAGYYALLGWLLGWLQDRNGRLGWPFFLGGSALWVLIEWLRGWLFSGFPWLALGYSQTDAPLGGLAPVLGVYGISFALVLAVFALACLGHRGSSGRARLAMVAITAGFWLGALMLRPVAWTAPAGEPIEIALVQGNIPQSEKWRKELLGVSLRTYLDLSEAHWQRDLVIWPETAIPAFAYQLREGFLDPLDDRLATQGGELLLGIPVWRDAPEGGRYYNAVIRLGAAAPDQYFKRHLVPFGEFMPFERFLRPVLDWIRIPLSSFSAGHKEQALMTLAGRPAGISICYEAAFGNEVIQALPEATFLVNVSNDAWFGDSIALPQHLQIARMRSLETGREMARATNTGISALISHKGAIKARSATNRAEVVTGRIQPRSGATPYVRLGNWPLIAVLSSILAAAALSVRRKGRKGGEENPRRMIS